MKQRLILLSLSLALVGCSAAPTAPQSGSTPDPARTVVTPAPAPTGGNTPLPIRDPFVSTLAGDGMGRFLDAQVATRGSLNAPTGMAVVRGDTYIADSANHRIRRVTFDGVLQTVVGTGERGYNGNGSNGLQLMLDTPYKVTADEASGNVFFSELGGNLIRCIDISGRVLTVAGGGTNLPDIGISMRGAYARLMEPAGLAFDSQGQLYVAERGGHRILRLSPDWMVTVVAGSGSPGYGGDESQALDAEFDTPSDVVLDAQDNLYIADTGNHRVRKIAADGTVSTVAGTGEPGDQGDGGLASEAQLNQPTGLAIDAFGNLYIADSGNHRIRQVRPDGTLVTIAGSVFGGFGGDGELPAQARFNIPTGLTVAPSGELLVADRDNHRIRQFVLP